MTFSSTRGQRENDETIRGRETLVAPKKDDRSIRQVLMPYNILNIKVAEIEFFEDEPRVSYYFIGR